MKKMNKLALAAFVAAGFTAAPAFAQSWYVGAGVGQGTLKESDVDFITDKKQTAYTARVGFLLSRHFAIEGAYYDLGTFKFSDSSEGFLINGDIKANSWGVAVVGILPVADVFEGYGRVGYARSELKASASALGETATDKSHDNEVYYGLGARYMVSKQLGIFGEWTKHDKLKIEHWLLGVEFRF